MKRFILGLGMVLAFTMLGSVTSIPVVRRPNHVTLAETCKNKLSSVEAREQALIDKLDVGESDIFG